MRNRGKIFNYLLQYQLYVCLAVGHTVRNITMTLQFPIIQNVLFHIVTHLDFCHTMDASAAAVSGGNRR